METEFDNYFWSEHASSLVIIIAVWEWMCFASQIDYSRACYKWQWSPIPVENDLSILQDVNIKNTIDTQINL